MTIEELSQLSDEELRFKVAEKMGWKRCVSRADDEDRMWCKGIRPGRPIRDHYEEILPPFSTSLDAIHEAEKTLTCDQAHQFVWRLREQLGTAAGIGSGVVTEWEWHATARQRAIAFLLV